MTYIFFSTYLVLTYLSHISVSFIIVHGIKLFTTNQFFSVNEYNIIIILAVRKEELKYLGGRKYLDAVCVYFWATTPVIISILTFSTYTYMGHKLTAPVVSLPQFKFSYIHIKFKKLTN